MGGWIDYSVCLEAAAHLPYLLRFSLLIFESFIVDVVNYVYYVYHSHNK